jgi:hypothetical protein
MRPPDQRHPVDAILTWPSPEPMVALAILGE